MSSEEDRLKHSRRRKRNVMAKRMIDEKGAFAIKVIDPRKNTYKREKLRVEDIILNEREDDNEQRPDGGIL